MVASSENSGHFVLGPCAKSLTHITVHGTSSPCLKTSNMIFCDRLTLINRVWLCMISVLLTPTDLTGNACWIGPWFLSLGSFISTPAVWYSEHLSLSTQGLCLEIQIYLYFCEAELECIFICILQWCIKMLFKYHLTLKGQEMSFKKSLVAELVDLHSQNAR